MTTIKLKMGLKIGLNFLCGENQSFALVNFMPSLCRVDRIIILLRFLVAH